MPKLKLLFVIALLFLFLIPSVSFALEMPSVQSNWLGETLGVSAKAYVVVDNETGKVLISKNAQAPWVPASITKLVTVMVVLDTQPSLDKTIAMDNSDNAAGGCKEGGACIATKAGVKYRVKDLLYATLVASANNAAHAVARSTGLSEDEFVRRMNDKARELGAINTVFFETTGMDPCNTTTAEDFVKITNAAFSQSFIRQMAMVPQYRFASTNNKKYSHSLKNTNKLLGDPEVKIIGGKTGYLDESQYNFVSVVKDKFQNEFTIAVFGSQSSASEFSETKHLMVMGGLVKAFSSPSFVLGTSVVSANLNN